LLKGVEIERRIQPGDSRSVDGIASVDMTSSDIGVVVWLCRCRRYYCSQDWASEM
jgi:hypothetical protein